MLTDTGNHSGDTADDTRLTLEQARLAQTLSARELARLAGVETGTVTRIERRKRTPHMATIRKLAAALGCDPQTIAWPGDPFQHARHPEASRPN